jgi:phage-related protein
MVGVINGLIQYWPTVKSWLGTVGTLAFNAVGDLGEKLLSRGTELIQGMKEGVTTKFNELKAYISFIPSIIVATIGDLSGLLFNAGWSLMRGFYDGFMNQWEALKGVVSGMKDWITDHKGPIEDDAKALIPHGLAFMSGLESGIIRGWKNVQDTVEGMAPQIQTSMAMAGVNASAGRAIAPQGGASSSRVYNDYRTFVVKVDDLPELVKAKEFFGDLQRDHELVYGAI